jgi:hypothetical protein
MQGGIVIETRAAQARADLRKAGIRHLIVISKT